MSIDQNIAILKEAYQAWNDNGENSFERWMGMLADDIQWGSIADGATCVAFTRACQCKNDVRRYFQELASDWEMLHYTTSEFIAQGDRVVMIGHCGWRNRKTGKVVETPKADIIRIRDSKIVEFYEFYDTAKVIAGAQP